MCDYSLHGVSTRPAKVGDKLISTRFLNSLTRGFAATEDPSVAVCLLPGTELAFEQEVECDVLFSFLRNRKMGHKVARFRQLNSSKPTAHHDAIEFPGGATMLVTNLVEGQRATVLLPAPARPDVHEPRGRESGMHSKPMQ
jgi:hypothetical protein